MGQTKQSITIKAPVDAVWQAARNFHDMSWAPNVVTELKAVGDIPGDRVGSVRVLNGAFHETLREFDEGQHTFSYTVDEGPSPISPEEVSNFVGRVKMKPASDGDGTFVEWTSAWEKNDEKAYEFCHGIYLALLDDMKKSLE